MNLPNEFIDHAGNFSPKPQRRKKRGQVVDAPLTHAGEMNPPPLMAPRVSMPDPAHMFAKLPAHFGTMNPAHGRGMMMEPPPGNMGSPNLNHRKIPMVNTAPMMGVNPPLPKYNMVPGLGLANPAIHDKAMMGRGWWWEQMKQSPHHT